MKRILFFIGEYNGYVNAGKRIALTIAKEFKKNGIECVLTAFSYKKNKVEEFKIDGLNLVVFPANAELCNLRTKYIELRAKNNVVVLLNNFDLVFKYLINYFNQRKDLIRNINDLINKKEIEKIICFYNPFVPTIDVIKHVRCKSIVYQLDSAYLYEQNPIKRITRKIQEIELFRKSEYVFTMTTLYDLYKKDYFYSKIINRIIPINFPNVRRKEKTEQHLIKYNDEKYNILYLGSLDDKIRNPERVLRFICNIIDEGKNNICLYFVGKNKSKICNEYKERYANNIFIFDAIDSDLADSLMNDNVFLLNIGNNTTSQIPSKIIDYISTGNPIISDSKNEKDPCTKMLEKYWMYYLFEEYKENNNPEEFKCFLNYAKGKKAKYEDIAKQYYEFTPKYVSEVLLSKIGYK